mgnify:CR=1 FL=1
MSIQTLEDLYIDQLQDLYSANRQSLKVTEKLAGKAHNPKLQDALKRGVSGIEDGINAVEGLIRKHKADPRGEFLGFKDDAEQLQTCLDNTYSGDREMSQLAEGEVNREAA